MLARSCRAAAQLRDPFDGAGSIARTSSVPRACQSLTSRERSTSSAAQKPPSTFLYACQIYEGRERISLLSVATVHATGAPL